MSSDIKIAIKLLPLLFPKKNKSQLSTLWDQVMTNGRWLNLMALDEELIKTYGQYKGSMKNFIESGKFGHETRKLVADFVV